ncbi:MAG TPA: hypothetical protein VKW06_18815 [Candidatus Angelobacter sp.]|nr:hypothetical protein [Candidatus Angelobacter sp.]
MRKTPAVCSAIISGLFVILSITAGPAQGVAPTPPQDAEPVTHYPGEAQSPTPTPEKQKTPATAAATPKNPGASGGDLASVLNDMDEASSRFKSARAEVRLVQYTAVVKEKDVQSGEIFFRRKGHQTEVALWIEKPHPKRAVVKDDKVTFIDERTKQVTERELGNNKQDVEAVMNLGFGGRGRDLQKEYDVSLSGWETLDGVNVARLELVAKSERLRRLFTKLVLWIDPTRDVALQQQRFETSGDYQLTHYSSIKLSANIPDDKFAVKK